MKDETAIRKEFTGLLEGLTRGKLLILEDIAVNLIKGRLSADDLLKIHQCIADAATKNCRRR